MYRPPATAGITNSITRFTDEFMDIVQETLVNNDNVILTGDFNIHVDDEGDPDAQNFLDCMTAMGLTQHVHEFTHKKLHTLDLLFSNSSPRLNIGNVYTGVFVSDHSTVVASIVWERDDIRKVKKTTRCLKGVSPEMMCEELSFNLNDNTTLEELVKCYETECVRCMDKLAPTKTKIVVERKLNPWHNDDIKEQKRRVQRRERIWRRYLEEHQWIAYKEERNRLRKMTFAVKKLEISNKVMECGNNTKNLYSLVNNITGVKKQNPMPENITDENLAENFADFF